MESAGSAAGPPQRQTPAYCQLWCGSPDRESPVEASSWRPGQGSKVRSRLRGGAALITARSIRIATLWGFEETIQIYECVPTPNVWIEQQKPLQRVPSCISSHKPTINPIHEKKNNTSTRQSTQSYDPSPYFLPTHMTSISRRSPRYAISTFTISSAL